MKEFQTGSTESPSRGLFSPSEIEGLMRVEFDRAQRHRYPVVCMLMEIDRLPQLQDLYGRESKAEILRAVAGVLRASTRDSDLLGWLADDRLLGVFPHTEPDVATALARRMLSGARRLRFDRDGRTLGVSLSIGVAHNRHEGSLSFDTLVHVAEEGLAVAAASGGDRYVETELYQLHEQRRREAADRLRREQALAGAVDPASPGRRAGAAGGPPDARLRRALSGARFGPEDLQGVGLDAVVRVIEEMRAAAAPSGAEDLEAARARIQAMEGRIAKLTQLLGVTEDELRRLAIQKGAELGIASAYRSVQGIAADASQRDRKIRVMRELFESNRDAGRHGDPGGGRPATGT